MTEHRLTVNHPMVKRRVKEKCGFCSFNGELALCIIAISPKINFLKAVTM